MHHLFVISSNDFWAEISKTHGQGGGVYKLHCLKTTGSDEFKPLPRLLHIDPEGVLYIGKALSYIDRIINLKKSLVPSKQGGEHICGRRYHGDRFEALRKAYPYELLCVTLIPSSTPETLERDELDKYCQRFGEPPPLNRMD